MFVTLFPKPKSKWRRSTAYHVKHSDPQSLDDHFPKHRPVSVRIGGIVQVLWRSLLFLVSKGHQKDNQNARRPYNGCLP